MADTSPNPTTASSDLPPELQGSPTEGIDKTYDTFSKVFSKPNQQADSEMFKAETARSMDWGDTLSEVASAIPHGIESAGQSMSTPLLQAAGGTSGPSTYSSETGAYTKLGDLSHFIGQQLPALIPAGKALEAGRLAWAGSEFVGSKLAASGIGRLAVHALADFTSAAASFAGSQPKLADALAPVFADTKLGPVFNFLKTDPNGSEATNRFRNSIDNMGMGMVMSGLMKGVGVLAKGAFSRAAGASAEDAAKNTAEDIASLKADSPVIADKIAEVQKAAPHLSDEEALTAVTSTLGKIAKEGGTTMEDLAQKLTFVNGDNEAKASHVEASLEASPPVVTPEASVAPEAPTPAQTANVMDSRGQVPSPDLQASPNDAAELPAAGAGMAKGVTQGMYDNLWKLVRKGETEEAGQPSALLQVAKSARENGGLKTKTDLVKLAQDYAKVSTTGEERQMELRLLAEAHSPQEPLEVDKFLAKNTDTHAVLPNEENLGRSVAGLDDVGRVAFHKARMIAGQLGRIPTDKELTSALKADGAAITPSSAEDVLLKKKLTKMSAGDAKDLLKRIEAYHSPTPALPEAVKPDIASIKPKMGVVNINGDEKVVKTYDVGGVKVHAERIGTSYNLFTDNGKVSTLAKSGVTLDDLNSSIAEVATDSMRHYQTVNGVRNGYAQVLDGKAIIGLFKTSDVSTLVHELAHGADMLGVAPEYFSKLKESLGFAADDKSKAAAEAVATTFERFAFHGELDDPALKPGAKKLSQFMSAVYKDVEKTPIGLEVSEPVRMAFRGLGGVKAVGDNVGVRPEIAELKQRYMNVNMDDPKAVQDIFDKATSTYLNVGTIKGQDAQAVTKELQNVFDDVIMKDRGGVLDHKTAIKNGVNLMLADGDSLATLSKMSEGVDHLREMTDKFLYYTGMTNSWATQVGNTLRDLKASPSDLGLQKKFEIAVDSFSRMRLLKADLTTNAARLLGQHRIVMPPIEIDPELANFGYKSLMEADQRSGGKLLNAFDSILTSNKDDPNAVVNSIRTFSKASQKPSWKDVVRSIYTAAILSHPRVMFGVQIAAGITNAALRPTQYIMGGAFRMAPEQIRMGLDLYKNMGHAFLDLAMLSKDGKDTYKAVFDSFKSGMSVSDPHAIPYYKPSDLTPMVGATKAIVDGAFKIATVPLNTMTGIDELWRQVYGRSYLRSRGMQAAAADGISRSAPEFEDYIKKYVDAGFGPDGKILDLPTLQELEEFTFKRPLKDSTNPGVAVLNALAQSKKVPTYIIMPFVRTPVNIGREAAMTIPGLQYVSQAFREGLRSSDPNIAAVYRGKQLMGGAAMGLLGFMAYDKMITGGGPDMNTEQGKQWFNAGYRPYSLVFHNGDGTVTSVGYQQLEPFSTVAGMCANVAEHLDQTDVPEDKKTDAWMAVAAGLFKTWGDKRYLLGLSTALKAATGDYRSAQQLISQTVSGFIPLSGAQRFVSDLTDDADFKHTKGIVEQIQNGTLFKGLLEPRRDFFGKPVQSNLWNNSSPLPVSTTAGDPVVNELVNLNGRVTEGVTDKLRGLDLTQFRNGQQQSALDRRSELRGEIHLGGKTLHDVMQHVISSSAYQRLAKSDDVESQVERAKLLQTVVENYNAHIQQKLLNEYPDLHRAYLAADPHARQQAARTTLNKVLSISK